MKRFTQDQSGLHHSYNEGVLAVKYNYSNIYHNVLQLLIWVIRLITIIHYQLIKNTFSHSRENVSKYLTTNRAASFLLINEGVMKVKYKIQYSTKYYNCKLLLICHNIQYIQILISGYRLITIHIIIKHDYITSDMSLCHYYPSHWWV